MFYDYVDGGDGDGNDEVNKRFNDESYFAFVSIGRVRLMVIQMPEVIRRRKTKVPMTLMARNEGVPAQQLKPSNWRY